MARFSGGSCDVSAFVLWLRSLMGIVALAVGVDAHAVVIVTASTSNTTFGYGFLGTPFIEEAPALSVRVGGDVAGFPAEFGVDFTTTATNDAFYFLQNHYCVGKCTTYALTTVSLLLTNIGLEAEAARFDSQITPGHLARQGINTSSTATFDFDVVQTTGGTDHTLYSADGVANASKVEITTSDGKKFNGLVRSDNGDAWNVLDWSATNLNLLLDSIPAGGTSVLTYRSVVRTQTTSSSCADITDCNGVQLAFGDPRNNGGGPSISTLAFSDSIGAKQKLTQVIGRLYDAAPVTTDVVAADAPLPPEPKVLARVTYGAPFVSQANPPSVAAVPEPTGWLTMITGFGLLGATLRRRPASA